ncbi:MAG TPA: GNAT family N-acetyltransferase [Pseudonocardiaceae bacterium]|jgi:ribosomal protein S18 acetylase RimI-like enzyme|nr:GNAT family N-acetyltransferase [Pseudonocardiaceae bacterium]
MVEARRATEQDAEELGRLREGMWAALNDDSTPSDSAWRQDGIYALRKRLAEPERTLTAYVVDQPDRPGGLAACVIGTIDARLPSPHNPGGQTGYVMSVSTDPEYRRRGYSRACMTALLAWFTERGITSISLNASAEGRPLYESLGFALTRDPSMRLMR